MRLLALVFLAAIAAPALDVSNCACDPSRPDTMLARPCSLCREADEHGGNSRFFILKDNNPRKPNRWLLLPRAHTYDGSEPLARMSARDRLAMWNTAIEKARSLWGDDWGIAMNGDRVRTQCHAHIHIGRLLRGIESGKVLVVSGPARIPVPAGGTGLWIHPRGKRLHVHLAEQTTETVLLR